MIRVHDFKGKHWVCTVLSINQQCSPVGDSILCEINILLKLDCVINAALNHFNLNLAKTKNYFQIC